MFEATADVRCSNSTNSGREQRRTASDAMDRVLPVMGYVVGALGVLVSVLTITQGVRALTSGARLRERIIKDLTIRAGIPDGPLRVELDRSISDALIRLIATEAHKPRWWVLPVVSVCAAAAAAHVLVGAREGLDVLRFNALEGLLLMVLAIGLLALESDRVSRERAPLLRRLRAEPPKATEGPSRAPS